MITILACLVLSAPQSAYLLPGESPWSQIMFMEYASPRVVGNWHVEVITDSVKKAGKWVYRNVLLIGKDSPSGRIDWSFCAYDLDYWQGEP